MATKNVYAKRTGKSVKIEDFDFCGLKGAILDIL
jgi:hypothetical protein